MSLTDEAQSEQFWCPIFASGGVALLAPRGELDIASAPVLDEVLRDALTSADLIALDLGGVSFMDSTGARLLAAAARSVRRAGGQLMLEAVPEHVQRLLGLLGADAAPAAAVAHTPTAA